MLSPEDSDLVERDPALPGLRILLDAGAFKDVLLSHITGVSTTGVQPVYVRYKPGTNCLVAYRLNINGTPTYAYAKAYVPEARDKLQKALNVRRKTGGHNPENIIAEDHSLIVRIFPNDDKLRSLERLVNPHNHKKIFSEIFPRHSDLRKSVLLTALRYKPERRYVARLTAPNGKSSVLKAYTEDGYRAAKTAAVAIGPGSVLRTPGLIGNAERHFILAFDWLEGRKLNELLHAREYSSGLIETAGPAPEGIHPKMPPSPLPSPPRGEGFSCHFVPLRGMEVHPKMPLSTRPLVETVGLALAEIHSQTGKGLKRPGRKYEVVRLSDVAAGIRDICPHLGERADNLAAQIASDLNKKQARDSLIHGDFYADQVIVDGKTAGILDFDRACHGDPTSDLGNFIAHLERDVLRGFLTGERISMISEALIDGYREIMGKSALDGIELYTAAGLLRLAPEPFRHREINWQARTKAIIERVEALVKGCRPMPSNGAKTTLAGRRGDYKKCDRLPEVTVSDPFGVCEDPNMPFIPLALDPDEASVHLTSSLSSLDNNIGTYQKEFHLNAIRVTRYKPGRRCLIEYDIVVEHNGSEPEKMTLVGKVRAKGLRRSTFMLQQSLLKNGFGPGSTDQICVPEPMGVIPEFSMWLQRKVPGVQATEILFGPQGNTIAKRIAEAAYKLHTSGPVPIGSHSIRDELLILNERLGFVKKINPVWRGRIEEIMESCRGLAETLQQTVIDAAGVGTSGQSRQTETVQQTAATGIHRDFYPDQVIVDGERLYIIDMDLYCKGDPGLDIGNFIGHMTEQALRMTGNAGAFSDREENLKERYIELAGPHHRTSIEVYTMLTLARHIFISTQFTDRKPLTEPLMALCEERLETFHARPM